MSLGEGETVLLPHAKTEKVSGDAKGEEKGINVVPALHSAELGDKELEGLDALFACPEDKHGVGVGASQRRSPK